MRDGFVYYRALKSERGRLDGYIASLANVQLDSASPQEQVVFWLNGYNALVLRTVIDHYPIQQRTKEYPANSIRQIPGAFEDPYRLAGRTVTLDQIEQTVLPAFHDPRVFFALGRGAVGSGRLRSEAYTPRNSNSSWPRTPSECASRSQCIQIDTAQNSHDNVSSIFSWRRDQFIEAYADKAPDRFREPEPIERAVIAFVDPRMLNAEQDFLKQNTFKVEYLPFDWSLNDLTGRGGR